MILFFSRILVSELSIGLWNIDYHLENVLKKKWLTWGTVLVEKFAICTYWLTLGIERNRIRHGNLLQLLFVLLLWFKNVPSCVHAISPVPPHTSSQSILGSFSSLCLLIYPHAHDQEGPNGNLLKKLETKGGRRLSDSSLGLLPTRPCKPDTDSPYLCCHVVPKNYAKIRSQ